MREVCLNWSVSSFGKSILLRLERWYERKSSSPWLTTYGSVIIYSYNGSKGCFKKSKILLAFIKCCISHPPPIIMWLWFGCLAACSHLGPITKCPVVIWLLFSIFSETLSEKSVGKPWGSLQAAALCQRISPSLHVWGRGRNPSLGWKNEVCMFGIQASFRPFTVGVPFHAPRDGNSCTGLQKQSSDPEDSSFISQAQHNSQWDVIRFPLTIFGSSKIAQHLYGLI